MLRDRKNNKIKKSLGFTLVEMLVAIAVFMIVMTVAVGSLVAIIDSNRKAQAIKNVVNNINFALESISKDMRVGTEFYCYTSGSSYTNDEAQCLDGTIGVRYKNKSNNYIHYRFFSSVTGEEGNIKKCSKTTSTDSCVPSDWESITAPTYNVNITNMQFYVFGADTITNATKSADQALWRQPRLIITLEGVSGSKDKLKTIFNIQTTVSQRIREIH